MVSKARMQYLRGLSQKKIRDREGLFLVEGWHGLAEVCSALKEIEILLYTKESLAAERFGPILSSARKRAKESYEVSPKELSAVAESVTAQGVAAAVRQFSSDPDREIAELMTKKVSFVVALDQISDPGNLGAIIRTCDWFGVDAVLLSPKCVELYNPKVVRSTMGSLFHLPLIECSRSAKTFSQILEKHRSGGFAVYAAAVSGSINAESMEWPGKTVLVIGNESHGISPETSAVVGETIAIPKFGKAESLNAAIATGVLLAYRSLHRRT